MAKKVVLAVAGAGKTYQICHTLDLDRRNLILAFTHENIHNIRRELCSAYGNIPERTTVSTFHSFVYHNFILPYEPSIREYFQRPSFKSRGITTIDPPPKWHNSRNNPFYQKKTTLEHYVTKNGQYYCNTLSELALQVKTTQYNLVKQASKRLHKFFDKVWVDEFQDFRNYDYSLILSISKHLNDIILVGDYYQHSVSGTNNSGKPFGSSTTYDSFVLELQSIGFSVDQTSLLQSRRCSKEICSFVKQKLEINITSSGINSGRVIWVEDESFARQVIDDPEILKLVYKEAKKYKFRAMNWSYSKGNTVKAACVILSTSFEKLPEESFSPKNIAPTTINKLYVAMTRSSGDLYLMRSSVFKKIYKIDDAQRLLI